MKVFRDEIVMMTNLRHPNICMLMGASWDTFSNIGFVLEWAEKGSLYDVLEDKTFELSWQDPLLRMAVGIVRGLQYLHTQTPPIMHRDLKSLNVLVTNTFQ